jgi:hypothetical protein
VPREPEIADRVRHVASEVPGVSARATNDALACLPQPEVDDCSRVTGEPRHSGARSMWLKGWRSKYASSSGGTFEERCLEARSRQRIQAQTRGQEGQERWQR